jgi:hypothetical protein
VNSRLRRSGEPFLLPELMNMVFVELCRMVTPRFRLRVLPRYERMRTGSFNFDDRMEMESTSEDFDN